MDFRIKISPKVIKFLDKQSKKTITRLDTAFSELQKNPYYSETLDIKKLAGCKSDYRLRIGQLRILYTIFKEDNILYVYKIAKRGDVYR